MKKLIKCLAVLATVAVLVLNVTSCGNPAGTDNNSKSTEPDTTLLKSIDGTILAQFKDNYYNRTLTFFTNDKGSFYQYDSYSRTEEIGTYTFSYGDLNGQSINALLTLEPTGFRLKDSSTWRDISDGAFYRKSITISANAIKQPKALAYAFTAVNGTKTTSFKRIK